MEYGIGPIHSARSSTNQGKIDLEILRLHQKVANVSGHDQFEINQPEQFFEIQNRFANIPKKQLNAPSTLTSKKMSVGRYGPNPYQLKLDQYTTENKNKSIPNNVKGQDKLMPMGSTETFVNSVDQ